ncbi:peptidase C14 [Rhizoctonia solani AG-1 IA]|uniref:Peptidase C14 n=1 Tax=Thanatephorus cucumeris (strain AG1-IA) TaxID=983506 RepID=L8WL96_THACA|nr:peptidase C14 [Rhizoctonia solani AG-1 IA]
MVDLSEAEKWFGLYLQIDGVAIQSRRAEVDQHQSDLELEQKALDRCVCEARAAQPHMWHCHRPTSHSFHLTRSRSTPFIRHIDTNMASGRTSQMTCHIRGTASSLAFDVRSSRPHNIPDHSCYKPGLGKYQNMSAGLVREGMQSYWLKHIAVSQLLRRQVDLGVCPTSLKHMGDTRPQHGIMPFLMSLSDSIKHSKERLKRSLGTKSKDDRRPSSAIGFHPSVTEKPSGTWTAIRALLTTLESSTDAFDPLKSAISGLKGLMDIYEDACKQRKEYSELGIRLKEILQDLADHIEQPTGLIMTKSVKRIRDEIMEEAKRVANKQANKTGRRLIDAMEEPDGIMECYRRIDGHLRRITVSLDRTITHHPDQFSIAQREHGRPGGHQGESRMNRMSPHTSATYNSAESLDVQRGICTSGTRKAQIKELMEWANMPDTGKTCWMNGMAGTGKTTIAYTVCSKLDKSNRLGASFFCSRAIAECRQVKHIIPSIAYQLARFSRPFQRALAEVLEEDCDAHTRALNLQYQKLIIDPLKAVEKSLPEDFIVVIDALDECESLTAVEQILELLLSTTHTLPIRFLISSRPEREITERITGRSNGQDEARLVLHNLDSNMVKTDIGTYMRKELKGIPLEDSELTSIIERCGVLFIYAATICRYIKSANKMKTLKKAVKVIIDSGSAPMEKGDERIIDELYKTILDNAFEGTELNEANRRTMRDVLETAVCTTEPMSLDAMASLLQLDSAEQAEALLGPLRSVLNVTKKAKLVTALHASFPDFILSQGRSGNYYCNPNTRHATIAEACLRLIDSAEPKFNICALPSSFLLDSQVKDLDRRIAQSISPGLVYACRYWTTHLSLSEHTSSLIGLVHGFFHSRLLLWMEVVNLTKNMRYATSIIQSAEKWCTVGCKLCLDLTL